MIYFDSTLILTDVLYNLDFLAVGKHWDSASTMCLINPLACFAAMNYGLVS